MIGRSKVLKRIGLDRRAVEQRGDVSSRKRSIIVYITHVSKTFTTLHTVYAAERLCIPVYNTLPRISDPQVGWTILKATHEFILIENLQELRSVNGFAKVEKLEQDLTSRKPSSGRLSQRRGA